MGAIGRSLCRDWCIYAVRPVFPPIVILLHAFASMHDACADYARRGVTAAVVLRKNGSVMICYTLHLYVVARYSTVLRGFHVVFSQHRTPLRIRVISTLRARRFIVEEDRVWGSTLQ